MTIHRSNLISALRTAIDRREEYEQGSGFDGQSAYLSGLIATLAALERGEYVEIVG